MKNLILAFLLFQSFNGISQLSELSDEFNKTCDLADWINIEDAEGWDNTHLESYDVNISNQGQLTMIPWTTGWYQSRRSTLLYKNVTGDFVFTSEVTASNKAENGQPESAYSLAGLMIRTPKTIGANGPIGSENYVFLSLGTASNSNTPQFEIKNTVNDNSNLLISNITSTTAQIRLVRVGGAVIVLYKLPGGDWTIRNRYNRSDMPSDMQTGFVTYTDWNKVNTYSISFHNENTLNSDLDPDPSSNQNQPFNPDIIGKFEYGRFDEVIIPSGYENAVFWNPSQVPNSVILAAFGYDTTSDDLEGWKIWEGTDSNWASPGNWHDGVVPTSQDSILIPNCGCPEVVFPTIISGTFNYASLVIEDGGQLDVSSNCSFSVDLSGSNAKFINQGTIINAGQFNVMNAANKQVLNEGNFECTDGGVISVVE